jgi:hypothetical protein
MALSYDVSNCPSSPSPPELYKVLKIPNVQIFRVSGIWISCEEKDKRKKNPLSEVGINVKEEGFHPKYLAVPNAERSKRIDEQPGRDFEAIVAGVSVCLDPKPCTTTCFTHIYAGN